MAPIVSDYSTPVPHALLEPLKSHLPHSLSVLRRSQFSHLPGGTTPHAHFLLACDSGPDIAPQPPTSFFAAAYLDLSRHRETELFLYSPLQDHDDPATALPPADVESLLDLLVALFHRVRGIAAQQQQAATAAYALFRPEGAVMVGGLHEATWRLLKERRGFTSSYWNPHDVWLFRVPEMPPVEDSDDELGEGLWWDVVRREEVELVASRTKIPKVEETLMSEPCVAVRNGEGQLVAWAFMGVAGTLSTLHVEEPYRRRGIAKKLATKVLKEKSFADDGWGAADVHIDNVESQAVCKKLGGTKGMRVSWQVPVSFAFYFLSFEQ